MWILAGILVVALLSWSSWQDAKLATPAGVSFEQELDMWLERVLA